MVFHFSLSWDFLLVPCTYVLMPVLEPSHILDPLSLCEFPKSLLSLTVIAFTGNTESSQFPRITSSARSIRVHMLEWLYLIVAAHVAPCHEANEFSKHISGISCRCWVKTQVGKGHVNALSDRFDSRSIWNSRWSRFRIWNLLSVGHVQKRMPAADLLVLAQQTAQSFRPGLLQFSNSFVGVRARTVTPPAPWLE